MKIYIPSLERSDRVITRIPPSWLSRTTLVVHQREARAYRRNNPHNILVCPEQGNGLGRVRQWVIDNADTDYVCLFDDDIRFFVRYEENRKLRKADDEDICTILDDMDFGLKHMHFPLVGLGQRLFNNTQPDVKYWHSCHTAFAVNRKILVRENIRIPDEFKLLSDAYLTLALLTRGYANIVYHKYAQESGSGNEPGGCETYRTPELQLEASNALARHFPRYVKVTGTGETPHNTRTLWKKIREDCETDI